MIRTVRLVVSGRVQGVGFRYWVERQAAMRGVSGWVRNRYDGSVEALFSGEATAVDAMIGACRSGPRWAMVDNVTVVDEAADPGLRGFRTIASA
jgi:acylphosphatase